MLGRTARTIRVLAFSRLASLLLPCRLSCRLSFCNLKAVTAYFQPSLSPPGLSLPPPAAYSRLRLRQAGATSANLPFYCKILLLSAPIKLPEDVETRGRPHPPRPSRSSHRPSSLTTPRHRRKTAVFAESRCATTKAESPDTTPQSRLDFCQLHITAAHHNPTLSRIHSEPATPSKAIPVPAASSL